MTQANYLTAAEAIDRLALLYQHMGAASEALKDLARLEQTKIEAVAAQSQATSMMDEAQRRMGEAARAAETAKSDGDRIIEEAKMQASILMAEAQKLIDARKSADDIESARRIEAAETRARTITGAAETRLDSLKEQVDAESQSLVNLQAQTQSLREQVASTEATLEAARAKVRELMGD